MQHEHGNENAHAASLGGAAIAIARELSEPAEAHGKYRFEHIGPREECRAEYVRLRDEMWAFEEAGRWIETAANKAKMASMEEVKGVEEFDNVVTTVGKNLALDTYLAGSAYTVVGPFMGLINTNASAAVAGDTMASHAGWLEVGATNAPQYTGTRKTVAWNAASAGSKSSSAAASFAITSAGTVGGCFLVLGSGAVNTVDSTAGVLYSAGAFTGGSKVVANGDTLNVTYTASL